MAYQTGTATDYADLLAKLRTFLTTNVALSAAGQLWQVIAGVASGTPAKNDYVSFRGPGLSGDDDVFVSIRLRATPTNNYYNWELYGHTSYNPSLPGVDQPGNHPAPVSVLLTNSSIVYWFFATGRGFRVVTRISGRYDAAYAGLILPDHTPLDWSLPLFIAGSSYRVTDGGAADDTWAHTNFWQPNIATNIPGSIGTAYLLNPGGVWRAVRNNTGTAVSVESSSDNGPIVSPSHARLWPRNVRRDLDGSAWIHRLNLCQIGAGDGVNSGGAVEYGAPDGGNWYGSLDGVFYTAAFGASAEEVVSIGGVDYLLIPNIARTGDGMFAAFAME